MNWKKTLKTLMLFAKDKWDNIHLYLSRYVEVNKFKDERRIKIYSQVQLSPEQMQDIDNLYLTNYGEKVPYTWHRHFTAFTGKFDKYYFPELLYIPEFERFMNNSSEYTKTFSDKNVLPMLARNADVKMPGTVFSCVSGIIQDVNHNIVSFNTLEKLSGEYFIKPTIDSCSGVGCQVLKLENGTDKMTNTSLKEIIRSKGLNWVIQKRIKCHSSISAIYPNSVNTFRVMTYIWKNKICYVPAILRIGQGGANVDNAHAGGMFVAIDDDGTLHEKAFTEFKKEFIEHPDTHLKFDGYKIDLFPEVLKTAFRCHSFIPQIGCVNWDFTIDDDGDPVLIEANLRGGSIWLFQMAHGCGMFGEKTPEILRWMRQMKHTKKSERYKYAYGRMNNDK